MDTLIVGFSRPSGWFEPFSWLIRLAYWSRFSHAYVRLTIDDLDREIIFQASGTAVNFIGSDLFDSREVIFKEFKFPISSDKKKALLQFAIDQLGKPYGVKGILGMGLVRIGELLGIKINNPFTYDQSSDFCSEMTAYILENYEGVTISTPVANLAPKNLFKIVNKLPPMGGLVSQP